MIILGIDPGFGTMGWGVIKSERGKQKIQSCKTALAKNCEILEQFQKTGVIVICCDRGNLSARVTLRMRRAGYPAYSLAGGYEGYKRFQK